MKENQIVYTCDNENCDHSQIYYPDRIGANLPTFICVTMTKSFGPPVSTSEDFYFCDIACLHEWAKGMVENMVYDKIAEGTEDEAPGHNDLSKRQGGPVSAYHPSSVNANKITPVSKIGIRTHSVKM